MEKIIAASTWNNLENSDVATIGSFSVLFANIVQAIAALSGVVLFIMLLMGGFSFLFSGGEPKKLEKAKGTITSALIGLAVLTGAYLILLVIQAVTGITDLTIFKIYKTGP